MGVMVVVDKVPRARAYEMGRTLLIPFNPIFRIAGVPHLQGITVGSQGYILARPELNLDPRTTPGFLPSIVGEFRWNFPWPICAFWYAMYGIVLRLIYHRLILKKGDLASVAIYAVFGLYVVEMIFQSPTQNVFEMTDVVAPMFLIRFLSQRRSAVATILEPRSESAAGPARTPHDLHASG